MQDAGNCVGKGLNALGTKNLTTAQAPDRNLHIVKGRRPLHLAHRGKAQQTAKTPAMPLDTLKLPLCSPPITTLSKQKTRNKEPQQRHCTARRKLRRRLARLRAPEPLLKGRRPATTRRALAALR